MKPFMISTKRGMRELKTKSYSTKTFVACRLYQGDIPQQAAFDIFVNHKKIGQWIGMVLYPNSTDPVSSNLMNFLLSVSKEENAE